MTEPYECGGVYKGQSYQSAAALDAAVMNRVQRL